MTDTATEDPKVLHPAEIAHLEAQTAAQLALQSKLTAESAHHTQLARKIGAEADFYQVNARQQLRAERELLADDRFHHTYNFTGSVNSTTSTRAMEQLGIWSRLAETDPAGPQALDIEFIINSPGGSVIEGMALFDYMLYMRAKGHKITTVALGMAASMGGILLQAGDHRVIGRQSYMLIHEVAFGAVGKIGEVEDTVELSIKMQRRILGIFAERSTLSAKQLGNRWERKDWWLDADEAFALKLVDEIR